MTSTLTFRVLATDYSAFTIIQPLLQALTGEAPNVRIELQSREIAEHADHLQRSEIDLAIVPERFSRRTGLPTEPLFSDRFVAVAWRANDAVRGRLTFAQLARLPYLTYSLGPLDSMVDALLGELGHGRRGDTIVESFVVGALLVKGTRQVTFVQHRLAAALAEVGELQILEPPCEIPPITETLTWHPRSTNDPAHRWLRRRLTALASELKMGTERPIWWSSRCLTAPPRVASMACQSGQSTRRTTCRDTWCSGAFRRA